MSQHKIIINNQSDKPDNIVKDQHMLIEACLKLESQLPEFMNDYFIFLRNSVSTSTRYEYLKDILFYCNYLINGTDITAATDPKEITIEDFKKIKAKDVNRFIDYCSRYTIKKDDKIVIVENSNKTLIRKRASLSSLFKFLYRDEMIEKNITDGFNPIKIPKMQPDSIKRLQIDEVMFMLEAVETGKGLTKQEKVFWEKTKLRDKAILVLFTTYGLRLKELQQLNISSFNFKRGEFKIYRKRDKEVNMPINRSVEKVIKDYIENERPKEGINKEDEDALFLSTKKNKRMTERQIRRLVKKYTSIALETSREKGYSPHKLRATAASSLIEEGFSIYEVQNLLDHDNVTTTQLYAAHKKNAKREILKNFELLEK